MAILILLGTLALAFFIYDLSVNLWWVGDHWCIGSAVKCLGGAL